MNTLYNKEPHVIFAHPGLVQRFRDWLLENGCPACRSRARPNQFSGNIIECRCGATFVLHRNRVKVNYRCSRHGWTDTTERAAALALDHLRRDGGQPGRVAS